jgi:hypothetical protein
LKSWVNEPPHELGNILDNVLTKEQFEDISINVAPAKRVSDHYPIFT